MFTTKRTIIAILAVLFTVCFAHLVWSHCHDEPQGTCEDVVNDLDSYKYWYKPSYNTVKYKINVTSHPTEENLTHDVKLAASRWHRMWYDDGEGTTGRIKFGLKYDGTTTTRPSNGNDGVNTIGYGHLSWVHNNWVPAAVFATPYVNDNDRIKDADMLRLCNLCPVGYIPQFFLEPLGQRVTTAFRHLAPTRHRYRPPIFPMLVFGGSLRSHVSLYLQTSLSTVLRQPAVNTG